MYRVVGIKYNNNVFFNKRQPIIHTGVQPPANTYWTTRLRTCSPPWLARQATYSPLERSTAEAASVRLFRSLPPQGMFTYHTILGSMPKPGFTTRFSKCVVVLGRAVEPGTTNSHRGLAPVRLVPPTLPKRAYPTAVPPPRIRSITTMGPSERMAGPPRVHSSLERPIGFQEHGRSAPLSVPHTGRPLPTPPGFSVHFATMNSSLRAYDLQHAPDQGDRKPQPKRAQPCSNRADRPFLRTKTDPILRMS